MERVVCRCDSCQEATHHAQISNPSLDVGWGEFRPSLGGSFAILMFRGACKLFADPLQQGRVSVRKKERKASNEEEEKEQKRCFCSQGSGGRCSVGGRG